MVLMIIFKYKFANTSCLKAALVNIDGQSLLNYLDLEQSTL